MIDSTQAAGIGKPMFTPVLLSLLCQLCLLCMAAWPPAASAQNQYGLLNPVDDDTPWGVYLQPLYGTSSRGGNAAEPGFESYTRGMEAGIDRRFGQDWALGAMIGVGSARVNFTGSAWVDNDFEDQSTSTFGVYGGYSDGPWTFADTLSMTRVEHDSSRNAGLGQFAVAGYASQLAAIQH